MACRTRGHTSKLINLPCVLDEFQVLPALARDRLMDHASVCRALQWFVYVCANSRDATTFITLYSYYVIALF